MTQTKGSLSVRELAKLLGMLSATRHLVLPAPPLLLAAAMSGNPVTHDRWSTLFNALVIMDPSAKEDLE